jgi:chitinase
VIWFAINLVSTEEGVPGITGGPDYDCVASVASEIDSMGLKTTHLISIGGWDAPHPDDSFTGFEYTQAFDEWNSGLPRPFDGFDWDLEGNDDPSSINNVFTALTLNQMVDMSISSKELGYIVTMVPAQSYLDITTSDFNLSLLNNYPDYHSEFYYHGMNCYAYLIAASPYNTFDLITVQLYESW